MKKARGVRAKQHEVMADHLCHICKDALETRVVLPRGARAPNDAGPPGKYYRESCANAGSTPLKRLRCQNLCCMAYEQHIKPRGVKPSDRAHCDGIECKVKCRAIGTRGKALTKAAKDRGAPKRGASAK